MRMDRSLAHDVRGVIAAANSNLEYARSHALPSEVIAALAESMNELRVVADVIALLGSTGERVLEIDLRAALLVHRGAAAIAVDATEEPFLVHGTAARLGELATQLCALAPRGRAQSTRDRFTLTPIERDAGAVALDLGLTVQVEGSTLLLLRND